MKKKAVLKFIVKHRENWGFPGGPSDKESTCQCKSCKRCTFDPWIQKIPWRGKWQSIPVFLSGKFHEQRILVGYKYMGMQGVGQYSCCLARVKAETSGVSAKDNFIPLEAVLAGSSPCRK